MEMKNICGKIPVELHEKLKLEVEELGISIPKYLEMVIEEHMTRKGEKTNMAEEPETEPDEAEADEEPTEPENEEPAEAEPTELETEEAEESEPEEAESEE